MVIAWVLQFLNINRVNNFDTFGSILPVNEQPLEVPINRAVLHYATV